MPSMKARVVSDRPLDWGSPTTSAVDEMAKGVAEHLASTILEAEGRCYGNPGVQAGKKIVIGGVAEEFTGEWIVTAARHEFESEVGGYSTYFEVSGRHDRTLLGLASLGDASVRPSTIHGNVDRRRHQQQRPEEDGAGSSSASRGSPRSTRPTGRACVQVGMGKEWGNLFLPEVGDEVLVGFEFGDSRRPYVIGGLINGKTVASAAVDRGQVGRACRRRS